MNRSKSYKTLNCKICNTPVKGVGHEAASVTCWKCVQKSLNVNWIENQNDIFPKEQK